MNIEKFYEELQKRKKPNDPDDPYQGLTHCILSYGHHRFEVRGWNPLSDNKIEIAAVNWTVAAGYCILTIDNNNVNMFAIVD